MSILIESMDMPKSCYVCPFCDYVSARCDAVKGNPYTPESRYEKRADFCPLVPVPGHHGRLIDADALMNEFEKAQRTMQQHGREYSCSFMSSSQELSTEWYCVEDMLENAPTIIPADPAEEGET